MLQSSFLQAIYGFAHFDTRRVMRMSSIKTRQDPCSRVASQPASQPVASGDASHQRVTPSLSSTCPPFVNKLVLLLSSSKGGTTLSRVVFSTGNFLNLVIIVVQLQSQSARSPTQQSCPSKQASKAPAAPPCLLSRQNRRCLRMQHRLQRSNETLNTIAPDYMYIHMSIRT
jgi:hypothetical protein